MKCRNCADGKTTRPVPKDDGIEWLIEECEVCKGTGEYPEPETDE